MFGGQAVETGEPADEGDHDGEVDEDELAHVLQHAAVGDLQLAERLAGGKDVGDASEAHHVGHGEEHPGQDLGIWDSVVLARGDDIKDNQLLIAQRRDATVRSVEHHQGKQQQQKDDLDRIWGSTNSP